MINRPIYAKSAILDGRRITLSSHTGHVLRATTQMFGDHGHPKRLVHRWLRFFRLEATDFDVFFSNLWLAAACHDLGKANDGFQAMLDHTAQQSIRHEHLSGLLLWLAPVRTWLESLRPAGIDPEIVVGAVISHHLKARHEDICACLDERRAPVQVLAGSFDVHESLRLAAEPFGGLPDTVVLSDMFWRFDVEIRQHAEQLRRALHQFRRAIGRDPRSFVCRDDRRRRLLLAVKAAVIAVDSAGSTVTRLPTDLDAWISAAFGTRTLTPGDIDHAVIAPRIAELTDLGRWNADNTNHGYHDFQLGAAGLGSRALLLAGCGTGKTLAAWKWIQAQVGQREASRVLFLYPTRATATEGFRDYVSWAGPEDAALASGTARYELEDLFANPGNPADPRSGGDYAVAERLFALGYWQRRVFSATVDTFLAAMANRYAAICLLPLLADAVVVIDEVHSFDPSMFRALVRLLGEFDVPVLAMTASLPTARIRTLQNDCGLELFPRDPTMFMDLLAQSSAERYRVERIDPGEALYRARQAISDGLRVLWVVNTVARCQDAARELRRTPALFDTTLCYHSRFRLTDRKSRHQEVIGAFRRPDHPFVVVTTQVCEMSLDLDADVLISEVAPVTALIQRMGRCCRVPLPGTRRGHVYLYDPPAALPYEATSVAQGAAFVATFQGRQNVSHAELAEYLSSLSDDERFRLDDYSSFPDSGPYAFARDDQFREDNDYTVDAVLDTDLSEVLNTKTNRQPIEGFVVPVPRRQVQVDQRLGPFLYVASGSNYHPDYGFGSQEITANA
jgi:CRISPR-associated endonuclease/helicase Cas3